MFKKILFLLLPVLFGIALTAACSSRKTVLHSKYKTLPLSIKVKAVKKYVNIGIILNVNSVKIGSTNDFFISGANGKKLKLTRGYVNISYSNQNVRVNNHILKLPLKIEPSNKIIFANSKPYRGYLTVLKSQNKINIVNVLPIEDYLKGVVPEEVPSSWESEALKAQSVISRTYAIRNLNKHASQGFNLCSTSHCQVYGGNKYEAAICNKAIKETRGEVLMYDGKLAQTVFHSNCGGYTDSPKYIWDMKDVPPYLEGVKCDYHSNSPHTKWKKELSENFIRHKLAAYNIGTIKSIRIKEKTSRGAAKTIEISHSKGILTLNAYKFRLTVGQMQIKSHTFTSIKRIGDTFYFSGRGWGHKAGLCQWGAKGMAEKGKNYKKILSRFYPKTEIEKIAYK
jgi:stage II sporulation protein D